MTVPLLEIVWVMNCREMRWVEHVAHMGDIRNTLWDLVVDYELLMKNSAVWSYFWNPYTLKPPFNILKLRCSLN
jgi:hypothetical protein